MTYHAAHRAVERTRGRANEHICACGAPARDWALVASMHVSGELRWSADVNDYVPMCRKCHLAQDREDWSMPAEAVERIKLANTGRSYEGRLTEQRTTAQLIRMRDPDLRKAVGDFHRGRPKSEATKARMKAAVRPKRKCIDCGKVTIPGPMGRHLRTTNHSGWKALDE